MHVNLIYLAKQAVISLPFIALTFAGAWTVWATTVPVVSGLFGDADD
jgi:hypothetical protein